MASTGRQRADRAVSAQLSAASRRLGAAGLDSPRVDAELLLAHVLGRPRSDLILAPELTEDQRVRFEGLIADRIAGVPVQHLTGSAPFRHLELRVGPGVLIPRPETELIIELADSALRTAGVVVDLGAGSGAIALSVAVEYPRTRVVAVENSPAALNWLRRNVDAADARSDGGVLVEVSPADFTADALPELTGTVDVVLTNPPYLPAGRRIDLPTEVGHDPAEALFAGPDGLALMPAVIGAARRLLRPGGLVVIEHDDSQGSSVAGLFAAGGGWTTITGHRDLNQRDRFTSAIRSDRR